MANTISTSTSALATAYSPGQLVAMSASGDALVIWYDGVSVKWSYASSPYTSWTTATLLASIGSDWQAGIYKLATDNALLVCSTGSATMVSYLFTYNSGSHSWSAGSQVTVLSGGGVGNSGSVALDADAQGRIWAAWYGFPGANTVEVYYTADSGATWTASTTFTPSGSQFGQVALAYCGNYIVVVFCNSSTNTFFYARIDAHSASLGSWSTAAAITNCTMDNSAPGISFRGAPGSNYGVFVGDEFSAIPSQSYNALTDVWSAITNIGGSSSDKKPTLISDGTNLYCLWSLFSAANNYSLVYKKWTASTQTWDAASTELEANGTNIAYASGGYGNSTLGFVYTVGTATPWSVNFDTRSFAAPATAPYVPHETLYTGRGLDSTLVTQAALWYVGRGLASTLVTQYIARGLSATLITPITRTALSGSLAGVGTLSETFTLATSLTCTIPGVGMLSPTLSANTALATTIPGVGTLTGTLSLSTALSDTLAGVGTLSGTLSLATALSTTFAGIGALSGTLSLSTALTCTFAGVGTLAGTTQLSTALATTLIGVGTLSGTLSIAGGVALAVTFAGMGTLTGALTGGAALAQFLSAIWVTRDLVGTWRTRDLIGTWVIRDEKGTWDTRDDQATWDTRDDKATWKTR